MRNLLIPVIATLALAIAGCNNINVNLVCEPPTATPGAGSYAEAVEVALSTITPGASIAFTIDGSTPVPGVSADYATPILISETTTIRAVAYRSQYFDSAEIESTYEISAAAGASPWIARAQMPTARQQAIAESVGGVMYVIGGVVSGPGTVLDSVERYDPAADSWTTGAPIPNARYRAGSAVIDGKISVIGGTPTGTVVDVFDPGTNGWTTQATSMPTNRSQLGVAEVGGKIYAFGGSAQLSVDEYNPATDTWVAKTATTQAREGLVAATVGAKIYLIGGYSDGLGSAVGSVEEYDPVADTFTARTGMPTARVGAASAVIGSEIFVIGGWLGFGTSYQDAVEIYNPSADSWRTGASMPAARKDTSATQINGVIYVVGGENVPDENLTVLESFAP